MAPKRRRPVTPPTRRPGASPARTKPAPLPSPTKSKVSLGFSLLGTAQSVAEKLFLFTFLGSTPVSAVAVFACGGSREWWALANSYTFSSAYCLLYLWPLIAPRGGASFAERLDSATRNWLVWLSCFTQLAFQVPHNLFPRFLASQQGTLVEWPFYAYGLSDSRWAAFETKWPNGVSHLPPEVFLINLNDAFFGALVLAAYMFARRDETAAVVADEITCPSLDQCASGSRNAPSTKYAHDAARSASTRTRARVALALLLVWRDATLFRESAVQRRFESCLPSSRLSPTARSSSYMHSLVSRTSFVCVESACVCLCVFVHSQPSSTCGCSTLWRGIHIRPCHPRIARTRLRASGLSTGSGCWRRSFRCSGRRSRCLRS